MKRMTLFTLLALLAAPLAATVVDNGDGTFTFRKKAPLRIATSFCGEAWFDDAGATLDCTVAWGFGEESATAVGLTVCTQAEADAGDPLPTVPCTAQRVTDGLCPAAWQGEANIPAKAACAQYLDWAVKAWAKARANGGRAKVEAQREPAPDATDDVITDP